MSFWARERCYLIAEIGVNHNGSMTVAEQLVELAAALGWDAVKLQKRTPELSVPERKRGEVRDTPWGRLSLLDYRRRIEFLPPQHGLLRGHADERELDYGVSVWDVPSIADVSAICAWIKIPSARLTDLELVRAAAEARKPLLMSTGMSELAEVDAAVSAAQSRGADVGLLHCNSAYPAPVAELNLRAMDTLRERYRVPVGYSGHEYGLAVSIAAVARGAQIIERHVTLDRRAWGSDQSSSVEPPGMAKLARAVRDVEAAMGDGRKRVMESERPAMERLR